MVTLGEDKNKRSLGEMLIEALTHAVLAEKLNAASTVLSGMERDAARWSTEETFNNKVTGRLLCCWCKGVGGARDKPMTFVHSPSCPVYRLRRVLYDDSTVSDLAVPTPPIGIMGKAGAGKDTLANMLVERHGYYRRSFADSLKEEVGLAALALLNTPQNRATALEWVNSRKGHPSMRETLQAWGLMRRELQNENYWVNSALAFVRALAKDKPHVAADVRFPNEVAKLRENGYIIVNVIRPGHNNGLSSEQNAHPSETALDGVSADIPLLNDGTTEDLYQKYIEAVTLFDYWRAKKQP